MRAETDKNTEDLFLAFLGVSGLRTPAAMSTLSPSLLLRFGIRLPFFSASFCHVTPQSCCIAIILALLQCGLAQTCLEAWYQGTTWDSLHMFFTKMHPLGWYEAHFFWIIFLHSYGAWEGRVGDPGTVSQKTKPINKEHIKEFGGRYPLEVSWGRFGGESRDTRDAPPDLCVIPHRLDRISAGQTGHSHRTNGTRPQDGCNPNVGVSRRISLCLLFFLSNGTLQCRVTRKASFLTWQKVPFPHRSGVPTAARIAHRALADILALPKEHHLRTCFPGKFYCFLSFLGNEECAQFYLFKLFEHPQGSGTSRQNSRDIPDSSLRNARKTNFRGRGRTFRPPPLRVEDPHPTGWSPNPKS